eukprot:Protomagalhaensia_wolfi_Nauph_80__1177@NODE_1698_length_1393_cov_5_671344_g1318_i0_p1_GENE_NODE_1698_length_1393_cov_5_671344_g1318_i0NODE_1698_length_1393_cov_5_671344_g1318_i0_p1_ORF_typecomplete_len302_score30_85Arf/PF00025_21/3e08Arf/PF00025_21/1_9e05Ras/PF00071_22/0_025Ras/PF00071_22/8_8SRPRB/PF09439_10/0_0033CPT/PF07931_12/0_0075GTP_EFTU/PF00009_27/7_2e03GTP_EFTU/PF00009_27/0_24AAA_33/PF13671_6/0_22AAA_33/PF13671_6/6_7e03_NODE_1698_length_1393_cov_5_671344_g1318_i025930
MLGKCWARPSLWLRDCCADTETFHIRVGGPAFSGKTSIVRLLVDSEPNSAPLVPTDGLEISVAHFRQHLMYLYDSGSVEDEDLNAAKFVNFSPKDFEARYPDGAIFVIDGTDRGRLPLASKLMHDFIESFYKTSVFLILVAKCDLMNPTAGAASSVNDSLRPSVRMVNTSAQSGISPRRLVDHFVRPSPTARASPMNDQPDPDITETMVTPSQSQVARSRFRVRGQTTRTESFDSFSKPRFLVDSAKPNVCTLAEINRVMAHPALMQKHWHVFFCSTVTGDGIEEAFDWFISAMIGRRGTA